MDITMVMVNMGIHNSRYHQSKVIVFSIQLLCYFLGTVISPNALSFDWYVRPNLSFSELFSDNIELSNKDKKSGFVTEVAPGLSLFGNSPWSNFNLNYRLQGLYNAGGSDAFDVNHQLQMNSLYQAVRNSLFLQTSSSISQQNTNNSFISTDNLTGNRDRTNVSNFSISPYWTPRFGEYASGLVKFGYQKTSFDNIDNVTLTDQNQDSLNISDSDSYIYQARLSSGSRFSQVRWNLNYFAQDQNRNSGDDVHFEQFQGDARYFINRKFNLFAIGGYENNDYKNINNDIENGIFYTFGGQWSPARWYSLEAGYGNNKHVTMIFNPSSNLSSIVTYRNKDVGLNLGDSWDANINYQLQQANIGLAYFQETTTVQQVLTTQNVFNQGEFDDSGFNTNLQQQDLILSNLNFVDDVIIRKRGNINFSYQTGKSSYSASVFNERRTYEQSINQDNVYGASGAWQWQFAPRLNFYLRPTWQTVDNESSDNDRYDIALGLSRSIPVNLGRPLLMNTRIEFRHINQMSDDSEDDYTENRATANFAVMY